MKVFSYSENYIEEQTICYDIYFLCKLLVDILNDREESLFRFIEVNRLFIKEDKYVRYFIATDSKEKLNLTTYDNFKASLDDMKKKANTFSIHWYENKKLATQLDICRTFEDYIDVLNMIREELKWVEGKDKYYRIPGSFWNHNEDALGGIFITYGYLKDIFKLFLDYRKKDLKGIRKVVDYGKAQLDERYEIIQQLDRDKWLVTDKVEYEQVYNTVVNNQYQLFDVYKKEYRDNVKKYPSSPSKNN